MGRYKHALQMAAAEAAIVLLVGVLVGFALAWWF